MSDFQRPLMRMLYQHITGKYYVVWGFAKDFKTETEEMVILSLVDKEDGGKIVFTPLLTFWDPAPNTHPKAGQPRFQLALPQ